jgi:hypothetical protein
MPAAPSVRAARSPSLNVPPPHLPARPPSPPPGPCSLCGAPPLRGPRHGPRPRPLGALPGAHGPVHAAGLIQAGAVAGGGGQAQGEGSAPGTEAGAARGCWGMLGGAEGRVGERGCEGRGRAAGRRTAPLVHLTARCGQQQGVVQQTRSGAAAAAAAAATSFPCSRRPLSQPASQPTRVPAAPNPSTPPHQENSNTHPPSSPRRSS